MAVVKRTYRSGQTAWGYMFNGPGATRQDQKRVFKFGFLTKREAVDAEANRRLEVQRQMIEAQQLAMAPPPPVPKTLRALLVEFCEEHADKKLAPKTAERYRDSIPYLAADLLEMPARDITPLQLNREWTRLLESGGHHRRTKAARPLSAKSVRNIAGFVSAAYARGVKWGIVERNPATDSEPPIPHSKKGVALTTQQQELVRQMATGPWCMSAFLEVATGTGARRGEVLALRWSDIRDGRVVIMRSLTQTRLGGLVFKSPKNGSSRVVCLAASTVKCLENHRKMQEVFRHQFGPDYKADLDLIFSNEDGSALRPDSVSSAVSLLCRRLKLPKGVNLHTLRHSHGSHLLAAGVELPVVSERLGHSSVRMTAEVYSHAINGRDDEAAKMWEQFQQRQTGVEKPQ